MIIAEFCPVIDTQDLPPRRSVSTYIVDLMATIRIQTNIPSTFKELTLKLLHDLPKNYSRLDIIADTYKKHSIKELKSDQEATDSLGTDWDIPDSIYLQLEEFVCKLYNETILCTVNGTRRKIFWNKFNELTKIIDVGLLPPC